MDSSRPTSSRPMSRRGGGTAFGSNEISSASSGRIGTASKLSAMSNHPRLGTAKNIGIPQKVYEVVLFFNHYKKFIINNNR